MQIRTCLLQKSYTRTTFFRAFSVVCTLLGGVVGAGFLSGKEIARFFGKNPAIGVAVAVIGFFALTFLFLSLGARYSSAESFASAAFGRAEPLFTLTLLLSNAAVCAALFSSLDAVAIRTFHIPVGIPSALCALGCFMIAHRGMGALSYFCRLLVPLPTLLFLGMLFFASPPASLPWTDGSSVRLSSVLSPLLYVGMNVFLSLPVLLEEGARETAAPQSGERSRATILAISAAFSLCLAALIALTAGALCKTPALLFQDVPLYAYFSGSGMTEILYSVVLVCGIFTSLLGAYYPVSRYLQSLPNARVVEGFTLLSILFLSRFGVGKIVDYAYPAIGGVGLTLSLVAAIRVKRKKATSHKKARRPKRRRATKQKRGEVIWFSSM